MPRADASLDRCSAAFAARVDGFGCEVVGVSGSAESAVGGGGGDEVAETGKTGAKPGVNAAGLNTGAKIASLAS